MIQRSKVIHYDKFEQHIAHNVAQDIQWMSVMRRPKRSVDVLCIRVGGKIPFDPDIIHIYFIVPSPLELLE